MRLISILTTVVVILAPFWPLSEPEIENIPETVEIIEEEINEELQVKEELNVEESTEEFTYLGEFEITAYNYYEGGGENYSTASGATPEPYYTVAVDTSIISFGTILYIEDIGYVQAQDTGGAVKGNVIDLHIGYDSCENFGRQVHSVYVVGE